MAGENKILLHACCAICAGYPIKFILAQGLKPIVYFSNDNIDTPTEFEKRKLALIELCKNFNVEYIIDEYRHEIFLEKTKTLENEPERGLRCEKCIGLRLAKTAKKTKELSLKTFTTTLVISPHKDFEKITKLGENIAEEYGIKYLGINFKKQDGFLKTNNISKELNLYRQNYCGCEFAKKHLLKEG